MCDPQMPLTWRDPPMWCCWTGTHSWNSLEFQAPNKNLERLILGSGAFSKSGSQNEDTESDGWDDDQSDQGHLAGERSWSYLPDSSQRFLLHVLGTKTRRREVMKELAFFLSTSIEHKIDEDSSVKPKATIDETKSWQHFKFSPSFFLLKTTAW